MPYCHNEGICMFTNKTSTCLCPQGWTGTTCDVDENECDGISDICSKNGTCENLPGGFRCICYPGWGGEQCDTDLNFCRIDNWCHIGDCVFSNYSTTCRCPSAWFGDRCQHHKGGCDDNPCLNEGTCLHLNGIESCTCPTGWSGLICEENIDDCASHPCLNNSTCSDIINGFVCSCTAGYTGSDCNLDIDDCLEHPCRNGGTCHDQVDGFRCDCTPDYTGASCERRAWSSTTTPRKPHILTLPVKDSTTKKYPMVPMHSKVPSPMSSAHVDTTTSLKPHDIFGVKTSTRRSPVSSKSQSTVAVATEGRTTTELGKGSSSERATQSQGWLSDNKYMVIAGVCGLVILLSLTALVVVMMKRKKRNYGSRQTSVEYDPDRSLRFDNKLFGAHSEAFA
ncbi:Sushi, von Willebrand factor type A, EGF and pentraxin domain-containing protein 1 [Mizuhopecten yessoensis]|uniref:Sushi, von Willebrand factor type A, EGF and pentraxin domain-containing protein 1 n=1 Tax=Mizuhopecten yessoensis TaxID=6573 RepID=A0A210QAC6_MIZYE|nr:Sushi, von Willebrand factor type A, EGF and pentraxin domain-containing protein 1 [Mizuhopecten yessoensis]